MIDIIAFDADDTLWHNEIYYARTEAALADLLAPYNQKEAAMDALFETEVANLHLYGYGIKSFALSMIETAIRLTGGQIQGREIQNIIDLVHGMLEAPVELLDGVDRVVSELASRCTLWLVTKGDLRDQQVKLEKSGLTSAFTTIEVLREKSPAIYQHMLDRHSADPHRFLMVGNSLRSDILPVLEIGGHAIHIPYHTTWAHEQVPVPQEFLDSYVQLPSVHHLPAYLQDLCPSGS
jgi:putative hydrolase of the HAD superfamily